MLENTPFTEFIYVLAGVADAAFVVEDACASDAVCSLLLVIEAADDADELVELPAEEP